MASFATGSSTGSPLTLRVINVTDVYMLDNFPSLKTLINEKRASNVNGPTITTLTGDFLAPYLLSSLDFGKGMVSVMNDCPIEYVIWGNHEHDLPHRHVCERAKEYAAGGGTWINTNMQNHEAMPTQVDRAIVECASADGTHKRRVGLLGLLSDQPGLYRPNAFGGATIEDPWVVARAYSAKLYDEDKVDLVIPLCHLYEPQDEVTCRDFDFPLVISGHDHHTVDRVISGSRLVKAGSDAHKCAIVDLTWNDPSTPGGKPDKIEVEIVTVRDWAPDAALQTKVDSCLSVLDDLKNTQVCAIPDKRRPFTSIGVRGEVTSVGTFLCTQYKEAFNAGPLTAVDCVLLPGGNVRGGRAYDADEFFSLESLMSEVHPKMTMTIVEVSGQCIIDSIHETHTIGHNPYYMQFDEGMEIDDNHMCTTIAGEPVDPTRMYRVGYPPEEIPAENGPTALREYFQTTSGKELFRHASERARGGQEFLMQYWAQKVWRAVWKKLDVNADGVIDEEEFKALDINGDGGVCAQELMSFMHHELGFEVVSGESSFAEHVLRIAGDGDRDGKLSWEEFKTAAGIGRLRGTGVAAKK